MITFRPVDTAVYRCRPRTAHPGRQGLRRHQNQYPHPIKGRHLAVDDTSYNMLLTAVWALGERANAELKERWKCIRRIRLCPNAISDIVAAAIVLSTLQRGNY